jgi:VCBS repeat-containing protein
VSELVGVSAAALDSAPDGWTGGGAFSPTAGLAMRPVVAPLASGGFVVLYWHTDSSAPAAPGYPLRGQVYSASGTPVGTEFQIPSPKDGNLHPYTVEGLPGGGFVVVLGETFYPAGEEPGEDLFAQRFDSVGNAIGGRVLVHTASEGHQYSPDIAVLENGDFVVIWHHWLGNWPDLDGAIRAQRFSPDGERIGGEFVVTPDIVFSQNSPSIAALNDGGFIALWLEDAFGSSDYPSIRAQRYDVGGNPAGSTLVLHHAATNYMGDPRFVVLENGGLVVTWTVSNGYNDERRESWIEGRIFDSSGEALGDVFTVSSATAGGRGQATPHALHDGGFAVTWQDDSGDGSGYAMLGQLFDSTGAKSGDEFLVNVSTAEDQRNPAAAVLGWGALVTAWEDTGGVTPGNTATLSMRLFSPGAFDAVDDAIDADEPGIAVGSLFEDNGSGADGAPATGSPVVIAVNGSEASVGREILLPSGALLTVNADGTYLYDPNDAFDTLPEPGAGGAGTTAADSFTYTLVGGDTATVAVTVRGRWSEAGLIEGTDTDDDLAGTTGEDIFAADPGEDTMTGGAGDDLYFVDDEGDAVVEQPDEGIDGVVSAVWLYTLPANVEILIGTDPRGQGLYGNALANIIKGGEGDDGLNDASGGDDRLYGGDGHDGVSVNRFDSHAASVLRLDGGAGNDVLTFGSARYVDTVTMIGGAGDDHISAFRGASVAIDAGEGADRIGLHFLGGHHRITLGTGQDLLSLNADLDDRPGGTITVTDFEVGDAGDRLELLRHLHSVLEGWDGESNVFATGHLRLVNDRADSLLQIDVDGSAGPGGFVDLVRFTGAAGAAFTHYNLGGFPSDGGAPSSTTFVGTPASDVMWGSYGDDLIQGLGEHDEIRGGAGDDRIEGGDGWDWLDGQLGDDELLGEGDRDLLTDEMGGNDELFGGGGMDQLWVTRSTGAPASTVHLSGGDETDELRFTAFNRAVDTATLTGDAGNDDLWVKGGGTITLDGGTGNDHLDIDFSGGLYSLILGAGYDQVHLGGFVMTGGAPTKLVIADFSPGELGPETDVLFVRDYLDTVLPDWNGASNLVESGHLRLVQKGADTLIRLDADGFAGPGAAREFVQLTGVAVTSLTAYNLNAFTPYILHFEGTGANDILNGTGGRDRFDGFAGTDQMNGGAGDDFYYVDNGGDTVAEGLNGGSDTIEASANFTLANGIHVERIDAAAGVASLHLRGNDFINLINGNDGANRLYGNGGNDTLLGLGGDDLLDGGAGVDRMEGGLGRDQYYVDTGDVVVELADGGFDYVWARSTYVLTAGAHVESLGFGDFRHAGRLDLTGNELNNLITGSLDNNLLNGMAGDDRLVGLDGDDILRGGEGRDRLEGGLGRDTYYVDTGDTVTELAGQGLDYVWAHSSFVLNAGSEVEVLGTVDYRLTDALDLTGNELANSITGSNGANVLRGLGGADTIKGFDGNDVIEGGAGGDRLEGGAGADTFRYLSASDSGSGGLDQILDFLSGTDKVDLSAIDAVAGTAANDAFTFIGNAAFSKVAGQLRVVASGSQAYVLGDTNGDGIADFQIIVANTNIVVAGDFVV